MNIEDVKALKAEFEGILGGTIQEFQERTGTTVTDITFEPGIVEFTYFDTDRKQEVGECKVRMEVKIWVNYWTR